MSASKKLIPKRRFKAFEDREAWSLLEQLNEYAEILTGGTPNTQVKDFWMPKEVPWMSSGEINKKRIFSTDNMISLKGLDNSSARWIKEKSILIALAGQGKTRGKVAINELQITTNQSIAAVVPNEKLDSEFLFQNLGMRYEELRSISSGDGSRGGLNKKIISELHATIPNIDEQKIIGMFFQKLDHLINTQQKKLEKTKTLKSAYLTEMFPNEGELKPRLRFNGFSNNWESFPLGKIGSTYTGLSGKTKDDFGHGNAEFITYMNIFNNPIADLNRTEPVKIDDKQNQVMYGDVFFTTSSETPHEVGLSSIWLGDKKNVYLNSFCFGFRPNINIEPYYFAFMLRSPSMRKKLGLLAQGISRYNISKNRVMKLYISNPNIAEQTKIGNFFKLLNDKIALEQKKLDKLKNIKQAYLNEMFV